MEQEAFLYKWIDKFKDMYYIGVHKGEPDDGYICSSKIVKEEYKKRPQDFCREILEFGSYEDIIKKETKLLHEVDAAKNSKYYNMHNGDGNFFCKFHNEETKKLIKEKLKNHKRTKEHCEAISLSKKGKIPIGTYTRRNYKGSNNPNFGKKRPELGQYLHEKLSMKYIIDGVEYLGLSEIMEKYNLNSKAAVHYRINSNSEKFKGWNYGK